MPYNVACLSTAGLGKLSLYSYLGAAGQGRSALAQKYMGVHVLDLDNGVLPWSVVLADWRGLKTGITMVLYFKTEIQKKRCTVVSLLDKQGK